MHEMTILLIIQDPNLGVIFVCRGLGLFSIFHYFLLHNTSYNQFFSSLPFATVTLNEEFVTLNLGYNNGFPLLISLSFKWDNYQGSLKHYFQYVTPPITSQSKFLFLNFRVISSSWTNSSPFISLISACWNSPPPAFSSPTTSFQYVISSFRVLGTRLLCWISPNLYYLIVFGRISNNVWKFSGAQAEKSSQRQVKKNVA